MRKDWLQRSGHLVDPQPVIAFWMSVAVTVFFSKEALGAGFDVQAIELATNERKIAQEMTELSPAATSFEEYQCEPESLGVVLMSQILEHALDVNLWVDKAHRFLQKDGILAIALPNYGSVVRKVLQE